MPTKLGGYDAPGGIQASVDCFAMLALGEGEAKGQTGKYFQDSQVTSCAEVSDDESLQDGLLKRLAAKIGVEVPS